jgi:hypothetical protein
MKIRGFGYTLNMGAIAVLLAGCGGSQPPTVPGEEKAAVRPVPLGYGHALLYVTTLPEDVFVYNYPGMRSVGLLGSFLGPTYECSDEHGNVFFAAEGVIYEYPHDGDSPIATLQAFGSVACSADPAAAKLAVADGNGGVLVFNDSAKHGWLLPKVYSLSFEVKSCAYDGKGDLFAGGVSSTAAKFAELAAGSKVFSGITLNQPIASPGQLQWDGHNLALEDAGALPSVIYQFALSGSSGYKVDSTTLNDEYEEGVRQFWIYRGLIAGTTSDSVALWKYPAGGSPTREIRSSGTPYGVAVSVAPPH